jgi:hypothetical protein
MKNTQMPKNLTELELLLNEYFGKKAPQLPPGVKEAIVKYGPWITLVLLILSLPLILGLLGLSAFLSPFAMMGGVNAGFGYILSMIFLVISLVVEAMAIPLLFKREKKGWNLMFYSTLLNAVYNLISLNIGGLIIGCLISFYVLFQVREYYK